MAFGLDLGNLLIHLRADDSQYIRVLGSAEKRLLATANKMSSIGRSMTMRVTLPILGIGVAALKSFGSFDDAMTKSLAIMKDITPEIRKEMESLAVGISKESVTSANELAKSYFYLASAGLSAKQSIAALPVVERFAIAGAFDMALATDLVTDAQSALGLTVKDSIENMKNMERVTDVLVGANTLANASTQQFSEALMRAGPAMKAYGIEVEEGTAVLAAYADQGKKGAEGGELFSRMLRLMIKGFVDNKTAWDSFNISIVDANDKMRPLADIVRDLTNLLDGMGVTQKAITLDMLGFQARSQQTIMPLLGLGDAIERYNEELKIMGGTTDRVSKDQLESFNSQMKIVWNNVKAVGREFGEILAPKMMEVGRLLKQFTSYLSSLNKTGKESIVMWSLFAAAIGPVLWSLGKLLTALIALKTFVLTTTVGLIGVLVLGFAGLSSAIIAATDDSITFMEAWKGFWDEQIEGVKALTVDLGTLVEAWNSWIEKKGLGTGGGQGSFGGSLGQPEKEWEGSFGLHRWVNGEVQAMSDKQLQKAREKVAEATHLAAKEQEAYNALIDEYNISVIESEASVQKINEISTMMNTTVQTMLNALDFEFEMLGKTTLERERSVAQAQFQMALQEMIGEEILNTIDGQVRYNELMDEYIEKLDLVAERVREINEENDKSLEGWDAVGNSIDVWAKRVMNWGQRLGEILVNAFDSAAEAFADMLMKEEVDWRAFGRSFVKELLAMIIKLQMAVILKAILSGWSGLASGMGNPNFPGSSSATNTVPPPQLARGGSVLRTGLAVVHEGETYTPRDKQNENNVQVNIGDYAGVDIEVDEYMRSDQRIIDVSVRAAAGDGSYRRSHKSLR